MRIHQDLADTIGNTPLLKLKKASEITGCTILGKAEFMNPGQSVKDRAALYIIKDAIAKGLLKPVLADVHHVEPLPLHALYPQGRHRSPRVAALISRPAS